MAMSADIFQSTLPIQGETMTDEVTFYFETLFQSTLPIQGETVWRTSSKKSRKISIHSPYTGRDKEDGIYFAHFCISIHSPYTGRDIMFAVSTEEELGISIHSPYTGRDTRLTDGRYYDEISIHSPYTGRD